MGDGTTPVLKVSETVKGKAITLRDRPIEIVGLDDADYVRIEETERGAELIPVDDQEVIRMGSKNVLREEVGCST